MNRRDMIKLGAVVAGAGVGAPGCGIPRSLATMTGDDGADAFNAMLDAQQATLATPGLLHRMVEAHLGSPLSADAGAKIEQQDELFRRMLGTLLVTQGFRELPPETQLDPRVQDRMWREMDDVGATVFAVGDMLAALDDRDRARVQTTLKQHAELPMQLGQALDARAEQAGLSRARRLQLRSMMAQSGFRLRNADPGSIIDEYVAKVERVRERGATDAGALDLARQLGEKSFWRYQHLLAAQAAGAPTTATDETHAPGQTPPIARHAPHLQPSDRNHPGSSGLRAGGYMLGIGVIVFGVSALLVSSSFAFVIGMTVGAVLFAIGLITCLISAIISAAAD